MRYVATRICYTRYNENRFTVYLFIYFIYYFSTIFYCWIFFYETKLHQVVLVMLEPSSWTVDFSKYHEVYSTSRTDDRHEQPNSKFSQHVQRLDTRRWRHCKENHQLESCQSIHHIVSSQNKNWKSLNSEIQESTAHLLQYHWSNEGQVSRVLHWSSRQARLQHEQLQATKIQFVGHRQFTFHLRLWRVTAELLRWISNVHVPLSREGKTGEHPKGFACSRDQKRQLPVDSWIVCNDDRVQDNWHWNTGDTIDQEEDVLGESVQSLHNDLREARFNEFCWLHNPMVSQ